MAEEGPNSSLVGMPVNMVLASPIITYSQIAIVSDGTGSFRPLVENRLFVDAVIFRYRTSIPWRELPERFGHWKATHRRPEQLQHSSRSAWRSAVKTAGVAQWQSVLGASVSSAAQYPAADTAQCLTPTLNNDIRRNDDGTGREQTD